MQSNSSSENGKTSSNTNLSPQFVRVCRNKILKSGSSVDGQNKKVHQTPSGGAPGTELGQSAVAMGTTNTELTSLGLELKLGNGVKTRKLKPSRKTNYRHHPYAKDWLWIAICGGSCGSSSEKSSERTTSESNGVEVCSSKAQAINLGLNIGVKGYEVDLELRLNSWI